VRELGNGRPFLEAVLRDPPDLVFNFAEGTGVGRSREARVPAVCEMLGIPYTGSDPLALAVALDKDMTRRVAESAGVTLPKGLTLSFPPGEDDGHYAEFPAMLPKKPADHFGYSLEVKRNWEEMVEYEAPAKLPKDVTRAVEEAALAVFTALGCRDVSRLDFRIRDGVPYFIEINPLPGLNPE